MPKQYQRQANPAIVSAKNRAAAHIGWAKTRNPTKRTQPGRDAFYQKFVDQVRVEYPTLPPNEIDRRAKHLYLAYFSNMRAKSMEAKAAKRVGGPA
ncbi:hypothetical protein [Mycobacterium sp. IS-2888]|uniref:hypothetical protein n=1 Tax=Mycobacterium sp. IS-2888 TaxID=1834159 RepID=UPI001115524A|nr:hypothetical protein [Mycobacterium sp. IS-2888]